MRAQSVFCALFIAVCAYQKSYNGYKVYRVHPASKHEATLLSKFHDREDVDFWSPLRFNGKHIDVMVSPPSQRMFTMFLRSHGLNFTTHIENLETIFEEERMMQRLAPRLRSGSISFEKYNRFDEVSFDILFSSFGHCKSVDKRLFEPTRCGSIGQSYEKRDMVLIKISSDFNANKPIIFIDAGIHAREWIAPAMGQYIIQELVENVQNRDILDKVDWHILPVLNPDGYEYSFTKFRMWRKTRSPQYPCMGTDGNRNFGFEWGGLGASPMPCSFVYRGPEAFSEVETQNVRDHILSYRDRIKLYLTFHSYGNYLLYPWGYTSELPEDEPELRALAEDVNRAIVNAGGDSYGIGTSTNLLGEAAGGSDDWAKGGAGIQLSYTVELPAGGTGFDPPPHQILPFVSQTFPGVRVYGEYIAQKFGQ